MFQHVPARPPCDAPGKPPVRGIVRGRQYTTSMPERKPVPSGRDGGGFHARLRLCSAAVQVFNHLAKNDLWERGTVVMEIATFRFSRLRLTSGYGFSPSHRTESGRLSDV